MIEALAALIFILIIWFIGSALYYGPVSEWANEKARELKRKEDEAYWAPIIKRREEEEARRRAEEAKMIAYRKRVRESFEKKEKS